MILMSFAKAMLVQLPVKAEQDQQEALGYETQRASRFRPQNTQ